MELNDYTALVQKTSTWKPSLLKGARVLTYVFVLTTISIYLSFSENAWLWLLGQFLYGVVVFQWFVLLHDFGHNYFFKAKWLNWAFGYISSMICLIPFAPWKWIHSLHHTWTGWHDLDPTQESTLPKQNRPLQAAIANFVWVTWIPVLTLAFSFKNFWNLPRLFRLFKEPNKRIHFIISVTLPLLAFGLQIYFIPGFLVAWALGYYFFLFISDPLLISQHVHMPQQISDGKNVNPFTVKEQDQFTRSLMFPVWVSKYMLLSFDKHTLHHVLPRLACYHLADVDHRFTASIHWFEWLVRAKKTPAAKLLFSNNKDTGLNL